LHRRRLKQLGIIAVWLVIWQAVSLLVNNAILFSGPVEIAQALATDVQQLRFWEAIAHSALRICAGFLLAFVAGVLVGTLAWRFAPLAAFLNPAILFIKSVPIVCFIVLLLIWVGSAWTSTIAVFLVGFPAFYFAVQEGLAQRDTKMCELLTVFRVPALRRAFCFNWPSMLPFLLATSRTAVGMSWKSGVAAELIGLPLGTIGERIYQAKIELSSVDIFTWMIVIVLFSLLAERLFLLVLRHSEAWLWKLALPKTAQAVAVKAVSEQSTSASSSVAQSGSTSTTAAQSVSAHQANPSWQLGRELGLAPEPIMLQHVAVQFDDTAVLKNCTLTLAPRTRYVASSPSGSGKTTFLYLLAHLRQPSTGTLYNGNTISMVFQEARLFERWNAVENVRMLAGRRQDAQAIKDMLLCVLPKEALEKPVSQLSGGMRRRVELCRALCCPSTLLLLDEPFSGLDVASKRIVCDLILETTASHTVVIATHDPADQANLHATLLKL
jgi:NitT/TauT family transport system permease protein